MQSTLLAYEHDRPDLSHAFISIGVFMSTLSSSNTFVSRVLSLLIFTGLYLFLHGHLVPILPEVHFLRFLGIFGGAENLNVLPPFHGIVISSFVILECLY